MQAETTDALLAFHRDLAAHPPELPAILKLLVTWIEQRVGSVPTLIFLLDPDLVQYRVYPSHTAAEPEGAYPSIPADGALARWLEECADPICVLDAQDQVPTQLLKARERQLLESLGMEWFLPMVSWSQAATTGRKLGGWIALGQRPAGQPHHPDDLGALAAFANLAALAIENVRLHQAVEYAGEGKSEFIDFVAHELKQPMTAILGYAKMLTMGVGGELTDTQRQFAHIISANTERMGRLIHNLLEISRLEGGRITLELAPANLKELVDEAIATVRGEIEDRHHVLTVELPADLPPAMGDRERLRQILTNLISNAYKYTPGGGRIEITAERLRDPGAPAEYLEVSISDSGIGMSSQELARMGEKFFRAEHELVRTQPGSGLGLSIAQQLITLHGGQLTISSEPDKGSTFRFTLPIADE